MKKSNPENNDNILQELNPGNYYVELLTLATHMDNNPIIIKPNNEIANYDHKSRINPNVVKDKRLKKNKHEDKNIHQSNIKVIQTSGKDRARKNGVRKKQDKLK